MIKQDDMFHIYTRATEVSDWVWQMQSISKEYLITRGQDWVRLEFAEDYKIVPHAERL